MNLENKDKIIEAMKNTIAQQGEEIESLKNEVKLYRLLTESLNKKVKELKEKL